MSSSPTASSPVGPDGFSRLDEAKTIEVLDFYKAIAEASPPGELYWDQSRDALFRGQRGDDHLVALHPRRAGRPARQRAADDQRRSDLAASWPPKTGIVTNFAGPSNPDGAAWGDIRYFGITDDADTDAAMEFVEYSMDEGYTQTLSIAPEGKFPVRRGTAENPTKFADAWAELPVGVDRKAPLGDLYDAGDDRRDRRRAGRGAALGRRGRAAGAGLEDHQQPGHQPHRARSISTARSTPPPPSPR